MPLALCHSMVGLCTTEFLGICLGLCNRMGYKNDFRIHWVACLKSIGYLRSLALFLGVARLEKVICSRDQFKCFSIQRFKDTTCVNPVLEHPEIYVQQGGR